MTSDEIMQMEAGRELDALVERYVMNQTLEHPGFMWAEGTTEDGKDGWNGFYCPRCGAAEGDKGPCAKRYSENIAAAWQVVEKMRELNYDVTLTAQPLIQYGCRIAPRGEFNTKNVRFCADDTQSLAICRAALLAVNA